MKVDYTSIIEAYERSSAELLADCADIEVALEADTVNTTGTNTQTTYDPQAASSDAGTPLDPGSKQKQSLLKRITAFIAKIIEKLKQATIKISNRIRLILESDRGFFNRLADARARGVPLKNFKAIVYQYNDQYLEKTVQGIHRTCIQAFKYFGNFNSHPTDEKIKRIMESENSAVDKILLSYYSKNKDEGGVDTTTFIREMIDTFRGEKKEVMQSASSIPYLINISRDKTTQSGNKNQMIQECQNSIASLKAMESKARVAKNIEELNIISKRITKATILNNMHIAIINMYYELKLEQILSARALLKKFYSI